MIPTGWCPCGRCVTRLACCRESRRGMIRRCCRVVAAMTREARGRRPRVARCVTADTRDRSVRAGERESRLIMVECRRRPSGGRMTLLTEKWETRRDVIRIGDSEVVAMMASIAR